MSVPVSVMLIIAWLTHGGGHVPFVVNARIIIIMRDLGCWRFSWRFDK